MFVPAQEGNVVLDGNVTLVDVEILAEGSVQVSGSTVLQLSQERKLDK